MPDIWGFSQTLLAVILGAAVSLWASLKVQERQQQHAADLQAQQLRHLADQQDAEWAHERERDADRFQLDTLGELQDRIGDLVTNAFVVADEQHKMMEHLPADYPFSGTVTGTDRWREHRGLYWAAHSRVVVLAVRVRDEDVRAMLNQLLDYTSYLGNSSPRSWLLEREAIKSGKKVGHDPHFATPDLQRDLNRRLGALIRAEQ